MQESWVTGMSDNIQTCVVFSNKKIEKINAYIGQEIKSSFYLAAYYAPKIHLANGGYEELFWCAVTNAYGLFKDCMPRQWSQRKEGTVIREGFLDIFRECLLLREEEIKEIASCVKRIEALRSVYCHNTNPTVSGNALMRIKTAYAFFGEIIPDEDFEEENYFAVPSFSNHAWQLCLEAICGEVERSIDLIYVAFQKLTGVMISTSQQDFVSRWERLLTEWIAIGKFEFGVIKDELAYRQLPIRHREKSPVSDGKVNSEIKRMINSMVYQTKARAASGGAVDGMLKDMLDCMEKQRKYKGTYNGLLVKEADLRQAVKECEYRQIIRGIDEPAWPYLVIRQLYNTYCP